MEPSWVKAEPASVEDPVLPSDRTVASSTRSTRSKRGRAERPRDHFSKTLFFFRCLTVFTIILSLFVVAANVLIIYEDSKENDLEIRAVIIRGYAIIFAGMIILTEIEWRSFLKYFGFLDNWIARGLTYIFIGLVTWDQYSSYSTVFGAINKTASFILMGSGAFYAFMGMACMKTVKEAEMRESAGDDAVDV